MAAMDLRVLILVSSFFPRSFGDQLLLRTRRGSSFEPKATTSTLQLSGSQRCLGRGQACLFHEKPSFRARVRGQEIFAELRARSASASLASEGPVAEAARALSQAAQATKGTASAGCFWAVWKNASQEARSFAGMGYKARTAVPSTGQEAKKPSSFSALPCRTDIEQLGVGYQLGLVGNHHVRRGTPAY